MRGFLIGIALLWASMAVAQQDTSLSITVGTANEDRGVVIREASDHTFLIAGSTGVDENNSGADMYLMKVDTLGNKLWSLAIGANEIEQATDVVEMSNGNYLLVGYSNSFSLGDYDVFIAMVSATGDLISLETYGGTDWDKAYGVCATIDGGYAIVGESFSYANGVSQGLVIKLNASGNLEWINNWGGAYNDGLKAVESLASGVLVTAGYTEESPGDKNMWVMGVSVFGDSLWSKSMGTSATEEVLDLAINSGQSIGLAGYTTRLGKAEDFCFIRLDNAQDSVYEFIGSYNGKDRLTGVAIDDFDDFLLAGYSNSSDLGVLNYDAAFYRITDDDVYLFGTTFGYTEDDLMLSIHSGSTFGFYLAGYTNSYGEGLNDVWFMRTLENGSWQNQLPTELNDTVSLLTSVPLTPFPQNAEINVYPNPVHERLLVHMSVAAALSIMTLDGKNMATHTLVQGTNTLPIQNLPAGNYALSFKLESGQTVVKIIQKK